MFINSKVGLIPLAKINNPKIQGPGSVYDENLGTMENDKICIQCGEDNKKCPGHFGHIEIARPIYYWHFIDLVIKVLKCVCFRCSKLLINKA